jgi:hypothetical protein
MASSDPKPISFSPSMPDITKKQPSNIYSAAPYTLFLVSDIAPIGGGDILKYPYAMAVFDNRISAPVCFVTLENSPFSSNVLCVFEPDGKHSNYGPLSGPDLKQNFITRALDLVRERFRLDRIEEMRSGAPSRSWWKFW